MVNRSVIQKRVKKAKEYLDFLNKIKAEYSLREFKGDQMVYGSAERFLYLAIESLIDIGNHIISDQNLGRVESYSDIPKILYENNYIDKELKEVFIKIVGFRNILVYDYLDVDLDIVYTIIKRNLSDLKNIMKIYIEFL
ncbi:type VII toxin-antitoxin system HepT family RNase toxin [Halonatronum saccharophilum]|uniref:type VII toxin-antitoxin system HepT family RNase toxin n=1 Tax=Halonatronum saccharophilum TaxID=150060 RepID=UPI0004881747|nr:DUF86 domain-containing protein [Halonatronum saccharophilum]